ncbi:GNAT family N-acetyltransferase [Nostoc sp. MS1]|uniref:GNAT family N-acetyltransferase n=1 Tax=Nostoc sp. MS1 TaxID=2764711 RepID=UPI001CC679F9|nr:GNAT family N-acetyltransferase [Nostoc sp. MS1]BCL39567.1 acetyltransferase [Nostoc sp. MS1]
MNAHDILLRPAQQTDAWMLSAIHIAAIKALPTTLYTHEELLAWRNYREKPDAANILKHLQLETLWVAVKGDNVLGFTSYIIDELIALYVHPRYQGRGIGRALVEHFCEQARQQRLDKVITTASLYAEGFYLRLGFIPIQRAPHQLGKKIIVPVIKMSKELTAVQK